MYGALNLNIYLGALTIEEEEITDGHILSVHSDKVTYDKMPSMATMHTVAKIEVHIPKPLRKYFNGTDILSDNLIIPQPNTKVTVYGYNLASALIGKQELRSHNVILMSGELCKFNYYSNVTNFNKEKHMCLITNQYSNTELSNKRDYGAPVVWKDGKVFAITTFIDKPEVDKIPIVIMPLVHHDRWLTPDI